MAASLVNLDSVTLAHGTTTLLDSVSLGVADGSRVGVVGRNGSGKSTLLSVLAGAPPDAGRVTTTRGLRVARLGQQDELPDAATVRSVVLGASATHEWAGDARVRAVLDGLGLPALGLDTPVGPMSGGERRRIALAGLLAAPDPADLLLLDEPTNHLDVEGVDWLARHLLDWRGGLVVVTHDRWFLDAVCTATWEVGEGAVRQYEGGYSAYVLARAERERLAGAAEARRQNLLRKELAWLRRGPPARTSKPRFRIDAANALIADEPPPRDDVTLRSFATARLGKQVYELAEVSLELGNRRLLDRVSWHVGPGDRFALIGVNGSGKTSLLRLLSGSLEPATGQVRVGRTVRPAYLSQQVTELDPGLRALEAVEQVARVLDVGGGKTRTAAQLAESFGFSGGRQWTRVGELSGGERRRLQLLRLLMGEPNVLLLDEPTNDLDVDTLAALEDLLDTWPGTLVVVSHDRYFSERVCDRVVALLGDGTLAELPGGFEEYLARRRTGAGSPVAPQPSPARVGDTRAVRKELTRIERELARLDRREQQLHAELALAATDAEAVLRLDTELRALQVTRSDAEDAWLELSERA